MKNLHVSKPFQKPLIITVQSCLRSLEKHIRKRITLSTLSLIKNKEIQIKKLDENHLMSSQNQWWSLFKLITQRRRSKMAIIILISNYPKVLVTRQDEFHESNMQRLLHLLPKERNPTESNSELKRIMQITQWAHSQQLNYQ